MPIRLYKYLNLRNIRLFSLVLFFPVTVYGQSLTGLWTGSFINDSTTARKDQSFEIVLTEYNGKVSGYSRNEFIVNDTLYYIVKRVKGTIVGSICEVSDDEIIAYNFPGKLEKGIKVTSTFRRNMNDSNWHLDGTWKTNATKKFYSVSGKLNLGEEKDFTASKLFPHLEELKLAEEIAFYKERMEGPVVIKLARPEKLKSDHIIGALSIQTETQPVINKPGILSAVSNPMVSVTEKNNSDSSYNDPMKETAAVPITKPTVGLPKTDVKQDPARPVTLSPVVTEKTIAQNKAVPVQETIAKTDPAQTRVNQINKQPVSGRTGTTQPVQPEISKTKPETSSISTKPVVIAPAGPVVSSSDKKSTPVAVTAISPVQNTSFEKTVSQSAVIAGRKSEFTQFVNFTSDSLELSLYDNGEIDGDTVSLYLNGVVVLSRQGLKSSAIKKTIHITPGMEEFSLVLFAENLGKYPPNTGLLVVHDGEDIYNLRFSSDLQKNAGIIFRKKR